MATQTSSDKQVVSTESTDTLEILFEPNLLLVSALSSLLRVVQAGLREVARLHEDTREAFLQQPHPILLMSSESGDDSLTVRFTFADGQYSQPIPELSSRVFHVFINKYGNFLKTLPQPGFWKDSVTGGQQESYASEVERRMDQIRVEMRRFPKVRLSFHDRAILIEGNRMDIG